MPNEITEFNVAEHVRAKVREVLMASIPDEQMDKMIQGAYAEFFASTRNDGYYGSNVKPSKFTQMVHEMLEKEIRKQIQAWLDKELQVNWDEQGKPIMPELVKALVPVVISRWGEMIVQSALNDIKFRIGGM